MRIWEFDNTIDNPNDWAKKYSGTLVLVNGKPEPLTVKTDDTILGGKIFKDHVSLPEFEIKPFFPKSQWLHIGNNNLIYLRRIPERQYQRSYNRSCYSVDQPQIDTYSIIISDASIINGLANTAHMPLSRGLNGGLKAFVIDKDFSCAFTGEQTFSICGSLGIVALGRKDKKQIWTFLRDKEIIEKLVGEEEWKINSLGVK